MGRGEAEDDADTGHGQEHHRDPQRPRGEGPLIVDHSHRLEFVLSENYFGLKSCFKFITSH